MIYQCSTRIIVESSVLSANRKFKNCMAQGKIDKKQNKLWLPSLNLGLNKIWFTLTQDMFMAQPKQI